MRHQMRPPDDNYVAQVIALAATVKRGEVRVMRVLHDDGCPKLSGNGPCRCSPFVELGGVVNVPRPDG